MTDSQNLPKAVVEAVRRATGDPACLEPLGGLSGSAVRRVHAAGGTVIVKGGARAAEVEFYRTVAPLLDERGVSAPRLHWAGRTAGRRWLVLEDVPDPLPPERWGADEAVLAVLARLHGGARLPRLRARDAYRPAWTKRLTASALAALQDDERALLAPLLENVRMAAGHLFVPRCPLSGDANPLNWGLRADGALVLFDWERFCLGTPALDLASALPGLGTTDEYEELANAYLAVRGPEIGSPIVGNRLALDIGLAKIWTAVELLAGVGEGRIAEGPVAGWLREEFPNWISSLDLAAYAPT